MGRVAKTEAIGESIVHRAKRMGENPGQELGLRTRSVSVYWGRSLGNPYTAPGS